MKRFGWKSVIFKPLKLKGPEKIIGKGGRRCTRKNNIDV